MYYGKSLYLKSWVGLIGFFILWQVGVSFSHVPSYLFPSPGDILQSFWQNRLIILWHFGVSAGEIGVGLLLGSSIGIFGAILLDHYPSLRRMILPPLVFLQAVPMFVFLPLLCLLLGYGWWPKVLVVTLTVYFPVVIAFLEGLQRLPSTYQEIVYLMKASPARAFLWIKLPHALPNLLSGFLIAGIHAPLAVIAADWIGANSGLGYLIMYSSGRMEIGVMFACILCLCILSGITYIFLRALQQQILFWKS